MKKQIEAMGRKFPATYKGLVAAIKSLPATGGEVHIGPSTSIHIPSPACEYLGVYVNRRPSKS